MSRRLRAMSKRKYSKNLLVSFLAACCLEQTTAASQLRGESSIATNSQRRKLSSTEQSAIESDVSSYSNESNQPIEASISDAEARELFLFWAYQTEESMSIQTSPPTPPPIATSAPSPVPSESTDNPATVSPTSSPIAMTNSPTSAPTLSPIAITNSPTSVPTQPPIAITDSPTSIPTQPPIEITDSPTGIPTRSPIVITDSPTFVPSSSPIESTGIPTGAPTPSPTNVGTPSPSISTTDSPTNTMTLSPSEVPSGLPTQFQAILSYQNVTGVCAGATDGIGCADIDGTGTQGNPNDIVNCFDVTEFVGGPEPFFIDGVRFWIGESIPLPTDLSIRIWEGSPDGGPTMGELPLVQQPLDMDSIGFGANTVELNEPFQLNTTGICVGAFSEDPMEGLRIRTEPLEGGGDNSFIRAPSCSINDFTPLGMITAIMQNYCIEAFVSFGG